MSTKFQPPSPPQIPARPENHGGSQKPGALVMHGTVSSDNPGTARGIAQWWHNDVTKTSAHYIVDPAEVIQSVGDHTIAYHCGHNTGSIAIELCDEEKGPASRWADADSKAIIARAATLAAQLCLAYGIEARRPSIAELKAKGPHGIYGHNDSRLAFGNTTHSDPIDFPWEHFLGMVRAEIKRIEGEPPKPTPTPVKGRFAKRAAAALATLAVFAGAVFGVTNHGGSPGGRPVVGARQSIDVFAWNEKSFPVMSDAAYRQDFAKVLPLGGKRAVFLHSEMSAPTEVAIFRPAAKALGLRTYGVRVAGDTAISTRGLPTMKGVRIRISDKLPAPVSPIRHLTAVATATPQPVTFISIHLSNRCFAKSKGKPWYAEQCRALNAQIRLMKRVVAYLVSKGSAVVIGGDQNVSRTITWAKGQVAVRFGLVQLTAVPSKHVAVKMTKVRRIGGLHTDHAITKATITLISR